MHCSILQCFFRWKDRRGRFHVEDPLFLFSDRASGSRLLLQAKSVTERMEYQNRDPYGLVGADHAHRRERAGVVQGRF